MPHTETIEELYKARNVWLPTDLRNELGHFNVFRLDADIGKGVKPVPLIANGTGTILRLYTVMVNIFMQTRKLKWEKMLLYLIIPRFLLDGKKGTA